MVKNLLIEKVDALLSLLNNDKTLLYAKIFTLPCSECKCWECCVHRNDKSDDCKDTYDRWCNMNAVKSDKEKSLINIIEECSIDFGDNKIRCEGNVVTVTDNDNIKSFVSKNDIYSLIVKKYGKSMIDKIIINFFDSI